MKTLESYDALWALSAPEPLVQTATSHLYKVGFRDQPAVLKILTQAGIEDEKAAATVLQWFDGQGAVALFRHDDGALLMEDASGGDLVPWVRDGRDDEATTVIAAVLQKLHAPRSAEFPSTATPLARRFRSLLEKSGHDAIFARGAAIARALLGEQDRPTLLHGDVHHENIRHHPERGWMAIDPKGLIGDRTYDATNALCNPVAIPEIVQNRDRLLRQADILSSALGLQRERLLSFVFAHACLSACWCLEDGLDAGHFLAMAQIAESCIG